MGRCRFWNRKRLTLDSFWIVSNDLKTGFKINRDGFNKETPIVFSKSKKEITLSIENKANMSHSTETTLFSKDKWQVFIDGKKLNPTKKNQESTIAFILPMSNKQHIIKLKQ